MKTVSSVIKRLMQQDPYYGLFACGLNKEFSDKIETAGVCLDGINYKLLINQEWWNGLLPDIRIGVIKHELLHLVFYHVVDGEMWHALCPNHNMLNVAMDLEVQSYIDPQYRWSECAAEQIFAKYPNIPRELGTKEYIKILKTMVDPNSPKYDPKLANMISNGVNNHNNWGNPSGAKNDLAKNQLDFQLKETAQNVQKSRGTIPAELQEKIEQLLKPEPPVFNWRAYFRRLLGTAFDIYQKKTRRKESNRFEESPGLKRKKKHKMLVAIDTSGSVNSDELREFFSEIYHIWKAGAVVDILECDMKISKPKYEYNGKMPEFISGRGGTSFLEPVQYYNDHRKDYTTMVYFTDGYGDQDECKPMGEMIWVITSNGYQNGEFPGKTILIPKKKQ
jgi:predicted metal-dependent peptidase